MRPASLLPAVGFLFLAGAAQAQQSATSSVAVLDAGKVLSNWREYREILGYVEYLRELDLRDLRRMREEALELEAEAKRNFEAGDLSEEDYRTQRAAVSARLRKLRDYWEIREEIINSRLAEDEQKRLQMMQDAVNDLGLSKGYDIILKSRSMVFYDPGFEVAPHITRAVERMSADDEAVAPLPSAATAPVPAGEPGSATEP